LEMFPTLLVLLSVATLGCALHWPIGPEFLLKKGPINNRIVGGKYTPIEAIPWQVSVQIKGSHHCGGVIYSKNIIITAAHCFFDKYANILDPEIFDVRVGSSTSENGGWVIKVDKRIVHDHYIHYVHIKDTPKMQYDIALILLSSPLKMGPAVKAIPLAESVPNDGDAVLVSGWGYTETGEAPLHLKSVYVNIVNLEECAWAYNMESTKAKICAAFPWKDSCNGDSGGPLTYRSKLVGIVSFGPQICGDPSQPAVYTDVVELRQWI
ncbi:hypothetical protein KR215_008189, partial [Drosophila sulfurigaster]